MDLLPLVLLLILDPQCNAPSPRDLKPSIPLQALSARTKLSSGRQCPALIQVIPMPGLVNKWEIGLRGQKCLDDFGIRLRKPSEFESAGYLKTNR